MGDHSQFAYAELPSAGDEVATLLGVLDRNRRTFAWKCGGLDADGLRTMVGVSTITLGGLLKHMALVEAHSFAYKLMGQDPGPPWNAIDWDSDPDWEWRSAADDSPEALMTRWQDAVTRSRAIVDRVLAAGGLDTVGEVRWEDGTAPNLRRLLADMIEEYARHTGHADLIRETVDGLVGEDAPAP
jgi:hypothetical protein